MAACAPVPDSTSLRDQGAPIGVSSRYDDVRFAGIWHVRGAYPLDADLIRVQRLADAPDRPVWELVAQDCRTSGACAEVSTIWSATVDQPGADRLVSPGGAMRRAVVVWVDEGFRTAAIGDPEGRFAWVLDRAPTGGADRIAAARQVLEFSGFELRDMRMRP